MAEIPAHNGRVEAYYFVLLQTSIVVLLAIIIGLVKDFHMAYSVLLGGLICVVANGYYVGKVFSCMRSSMPKQILKNIYQGEFNKLLLAVLLFSLTINFANVDALPFLCAYIAAQSMMWFALLKFNWLTSHRK